jgi:hypothetical protein
VLRDLSEKKWFRVLGLISNLKSVFPKCKVQLWALDSPSRALERWTVGSGKRGKFDILNKMISAQSDYIFILDDDIVIRSADFYTLAEQMTRLKFDLAQPGHSRHSMCSHEFLRALPGIVARLTTFVEIGPAFCVGPNRREDFLPFPDNIGMGWGHEVAWFTKCQQGARLGVVDASLVTHLEPIANEYDPNVELARLSKALNSVAATDIRSIQRNLELFF